MPQRTQITATVVFEVVTADDEELDAVCEDVHEQLGLIMVGNDWTGSVELAWETARETTTAVQPPDRCVYHYGGAAGQCLNNSIPGMLTCRNHAD